MVCEIHLNLSGFNQRQQLCWLTGGQPILLELSPNIRDYPVATTHFLLRGSVGSRSNNPRLRQFLFHILAVIVLRRRRR